MSRWLLNVESITAIFLVYRRRLGEEISLMENILLESLAAFGRSAERIDDILQHADSLRLRAPLLAEMLRSLWPSFPLYACLLEAQDDSHLGVLDDHGKLRAEWADALRSSISEVSKQVECTPASWAELPP